MRIATTNERDCPDTFEGKSGARRCNAVFAVILLASGSVITQSVAAQTSGEMLSREPVEVKIVESAVSGDRQTASGTAGPTGSRCAALHSQCFGEPKRIFRQSDPGSHVWC